MEDEGERPGSGGGRRSNTEETQKKRRDKAEGDTEKYTVKEMYVLLTVSSPLQEHLHPSLQGGESSGPSSVQSPYPEEHNRPSLWMEDESAKSLKTVHPGERGEGVPQGVMTH